MADDISIILDKCLERLRRGETVEQCLTDYPTYRAELEPLLRTFSNVSAVRRATPSNQFKQASYNRLMSRIAADARQNNQKPGWRFDFTSWRQSLAFKTLVPVSLLIVIALIVWVTLPVFSPSPGAEQDFTLSILSGSAEIKKAGSEAWLSGTDGMSLKAGYQIRTTVDSYALLTFFDSSTIKLEPGAEVLVSQSDYVDQSATSITLEQQAGKTWSYVAGKVEDNTAFTVQTPQCEAMGGQTAFSTEVDGSGKTRFAVAEGAIQVVEGNRGVRVEADNQIEVGDNLALSSPLPMPPSENELVISTALPGVGSVCDPNGASTGHFPDGLAFNQITNSKSVLSTSAQQIIVSEPVSGEYLLAVRRTSNDEIPVNIQAKRDGKIVFHYDGKLSGATDQGWIIRINLETADQTAVNADVVGVEPLGAAAPENVIETALVKTRLTPIAAGLPAAQPAVTSTAVVQTSPAGHPDQPAVSPTPGFSATPTVDTPPLLTATVSHPDGSGSSGSGSTSQPVDITAPVVVSTRPLDSAIDVDVAKKITATFSEDIDAGTINTFTFLLTDGQTEIDTTVSYDPDTRTATLNPINDLDFATTYTARIAEQAADQAGNQLAGGYSWTFTTASNPVEVDLIPPAVISVSPQNEAGDMAVNVVIKAIFDESMNSSTILDANNFSLKSPDAAVDCTVEYVENTQTVTYVPNTSLEYSTTYTATITTAVTDAAGNHLSADYSWTFYTGSPSQVVTLSVDAPDTAVAGSTLDVGIYVSDVTNLSAFEFDLNYDEAVLQILDDARPITPGVMDSGQLEYDSWTWSFVRGDKGQLRVLGAISGPGVSGSGYIVQIHFKVIGAAGQTSNLTLSKMKRGSHTYDFLFDSLSKTIATNVINGLIQVTP